jgi:glutaredoxin
MPAITIFTTTWCGHCRRLKRQFDEAGISYSEVDIEVASGGFRTVPTVEVGERLLVNPTLDHVKEALSA